MRQRHLLLSAAFLGTFSPFAVAGGGLPAYSDAFQFPTMNRAASFNVDGPATGASPDLEGDAFLTSVEYQSGDAFFWYYKPVAVHDLSYTGSPSKWSVRVGSRTSNTGLSGNYTVGSMDGNASSVSADDLSLFKPLVLQALTSNNLNAYVDNGDGASRFEFTMEFNVDVMDNDPDPDDFGEILLFERGAGSGNSWFKLQAVDAGGNALGPWLVIGPSETLQTNPVTEVFKSGQTMGTTAVDVSRLGVTKFRYLKISNDVGGMPEYTGGGDLAPDFKVMVVVTNEAQLKLYGGTFD